MEVLVSGVLQKPRCELEWQRSQQKRKYFEYRVDTFTVALDLRYEEKLTKNDLQVFNTCKGNYVDSSSER